MKLNVQQKNWLVFVRVVMSATWFGTVIYTLVSLVNINNDNGDMLYALNSTLRILDDSIIIPSTSLLTSALLNLLRKYIFRY